MTLSDTLWMKLGFLRKTYGAAEAAEIVAASLRLVQRVHFPVTRVDMVTVAALLSLGVALAAPAATCLEEARTVTRHNEEGKPTHLARDGITNVPILVL